MVEEKTIIFGRKTKGIKPEYFDGKNSDPKPRKKRSDAKHDIKVRVTPGDKRLLKLQAFDHKAPSLTAYTSLIVKKALLHDCEFDSYEYDENGPFVRVVLENDFFEMVKTLSADWDTSFRGVAHRIIKEHIWRSSGNIKIHDYRSGGDTIEIQSS